jgi:hypothetical protein
MAALGEASSVLVGCRVFGLARNVKLSSDKHMLYFINYDPDRQRMDFRK